MATNWMLPVAFAILLLGRYHSPANTGLTITAEEQPHRTTKRLQAVYRAELGVREASGNNDGHQVGEYLQYCGLGTGYAWCAAFVSWCHGQAGWTEPRNPWAPALFPTKRRIYQHSEGNSDIPRTGDVFGLYNPAKRRIDHCGFVDEWSGSWVVTIEGNVNDAVVRKRRPVKTIYAVARWSG